jgi:hypothetical protein
MLQHSRAHAASCPLLLQEGDQAHQTLRNMQLIVASNALLVRRVCSLLTPFPACSACALRIAGSPHGEGSFQGWAQDQDAAPSPKTGRQGERWATITQDRQGERWATSPACLQRVHAAYARACSHHPQHYLVPCACMCAPSRRSHSKGCCAACSKSTASASAAAAAASMVSSLRQSYRHQVCGKAAQQHHTSRHVAAARMGRQLGCVMLP